MIKVSAGLSRKIGGANFSSKGGSVHLEQEFEAGVIHDPERLRHGIRELFTLARQALEEELEGGEGKAMPSGQTMPGDPEAVAGSSGSSGDSALEEPPGGGIPMIPSRPKPKGPLASEKQLNYLGTLCERQRRDLGELCLERYGVDLPWLDRRQATELIDWLRRAPLLAR
jgi:hypothetical protein